MIFFIAAANMVGVARFINCFFDGHGGDLMFYGLKNSSFKLVPERG